MNVVDLRSPEARSRTLCGGKGAELAALIGDELPVPDGFVVTTHGVLALLRGSRSEASARSELRLADSERSAELAERLRHSIADG